MATTPGQPTDSLIDRLTREPVDYDLGQAIRIVELAIAESNDGRDPIAADELTSSEAIAAIGEHMRLVSHQALGYAPGEVHEVVPPRAGEPRWSVVVASFGLTGPSGALPDFYTRLLRERQRRKDPALASFLQMIDQRLILAFVEAGEKYRPHLSLVRARRRRRRSDAFAGALRALMGLGFDSSFDQLGLDRGEFVLLRYAGVLSGRHRPAHGLARLLEDHFSLAVEIVQFVPRLVPLPTALRSRLPGLGSRGCRLARNTIIGSNAVDAQGNFEVRLGPLDFAGYCAFLPDAQPKRIDEMATLVRLYAGLEFGFEIRPVLRAAEVPRCILGAKGDARPRLRRTAWLMTRPATDDFDELAVRTDDAIPMATSSMENP